MLLVEAPCQHGFYVNFCAKLTTLVEIFLVVKNVDFRAFQE